MARLNNGITVPKTPFITSLLIGTLALPIKVCKKNGKTRETGPPVTEPWVFPFMVSRTQALSAFQGLPLSLCPDPKRACLLVLSCRPPKTKFFFTAMPHTIFLSPGISFTLPIIFRPLEKVRLTMVSRGQ